MVLRPDLRLRRSVRKGDRLTA